MKRPRATNEPDEGRTGGSDRPPTGFDPAIVRAVVFAEHSDVFGVLGPHEVTQGLWEIRALLPEALSADVVLDSGKTLPMERLHPDGFFVARLTDRERPVYRLRIKTSRGSDTRDDPYRFGSVAPPGGYSGIRYLGSDAPYRALGAHPATIEGVDGFRFAVWAPNARRVSVVGDFNDWDGRRHAMRLYHDIGVWEIFVPGLAADARYKFEIKTGSGLLPLKADPVAFAAERPPATASLTHGLPAVEIKDAEWWQARAAIDQRRAPMSVYEVHLGSWARVPEEGGRSLTYRELAERLIPYVKDLGYTHIELLPVSEHPFDGSWGYQPLALFAPTSRFGTPEDFAYFVEAAHTAGIGVILDWVAGHFPVDAHGLAYFDGTHLYEHADPRQGFHQDWGTYIYNFDRDEVSSFLVANARFWLERYHVDGLRVDAVASMIYLDYSRKSGEWIPNQFGGNQNIGAIKFLRRMNETVYLDHPGAVTVAEESTAFPGVSHPTYAGGLGFGFKWNMGWMHDTLRYIAHDPVHRRFHHHDLTFGLLYAYSENYVLPISHDEVVHGKGSLLGKMPGDRWQKFANLRAYLGFMWGHPGKKLLFMGCEFGQEREWTHRESLDWHLLGDPLHRGVQSLVRDLNHTYRALPPLYERDHEAGGFEWLVMDDADNSVLVFARRGEEPGSVVVVACNFTPVVRGDYRFGVPLAGFYREAVNTDAASYGGSNVGNLGGVASEPVASHGRTDSLTLTLPPLATVILERIDR